MLPGTTRRRPCDLPLTENELLAQPLETERLVLRRFAPDDWQAAARYTTDADVMLYMEAHVFDLEETRAFVAANTGPDARAFAVTLKSDGTLIGHMPFHPWYGPQTFEIGWVMHPDYQRQGYATEAARALLNYGFQELHLHRIIATCQPENPASFRVMEKLGMRREAHFVKALYRTEDVWWDEYFFAILHEEWRKQ